MTEDAILLPTQEEDIFQVIPKYLCKTYKMKIKEFPNYTIYVDIDNKRTHDVELYEQFIIGLGKMGVEDLLNEGKDPLTDTKEYKINNGDDDPEGTCFVRVYAHENE